MEVKIEPDYDDYEIIEIKEEDIFVKTEFVEEQYEDPSIDVQDMGSFCDMKMDLNNKFNLPVNVDESVKESDTMDVRKISLYEYLLSHNEMSEKNSLITNQPSNSIKLHPIGEDRDRFVCKLCHFRSYTEGHYKRHMRSHTVKKPFLCVSCPFKCSTKRSLNRHVMTHTGEKPFACELCPHRCREKAKLVMHMLTHTGEKPFACALCSYKCGRKTCLTRHMFTHTGEKPYHCASCPYKASDKSSLTKHIKLNHDIAKPFHNKPEI